MSFISNKRRKNIILKANGKCFYCGEKPSNTFDICIDHVIPKVMGGKNNIENFVVACRRCNSLKGGLSVDEWKGKITKKIFHLELELSFYKKIMKQNG